MSRVLRALPGLCWLCRRSLVGNLFPVVCGISRAQTLLNSVAGDSATWPGGREGSACQLSEAAPVGVRGGSCTLTSEIEARLVTEMGSRLQAVLLEARTFLNSL